MVGCSLWDGKDVGYFRDCLQVWLEGSPLCWLLMAGGGRGGKVDFVRADLEFEPVLCFAVS